MRDFRAKALSALARDGAAVLVTVVEAKGSVPREESAQMLVTASGYLGSIGGGTLEWRAMAEAQAMLQSGRAEALSRYSLGPDLGQCCGGQVKLRLQRVTDATALNTLITDTATARQIALYGAGHVGRALVLVLAGSEFDVTWVDPRPGVWPAQVPGSVRLETDVLAPLLDASMAVVMSHSHALDFDVVDAALRRPNIEKILLIGSETKRARFLSRLKTAGHGDERLKDLICPIGDGNVKSKLPYSIAISTAHHILALDEALRVPQTGETEAPGRKTIGA